MIALALMLLLQATPQPVTITGDPAWPIPGIGIVQPIPAPQKAPQPSKPIFEWSGGTGATRAPSDEGEKWTPVCDITALVGDCGYLFDNPDDNLFDGYAGSEYPWWTLEYKQAPPEDKPAAPPEIPLAKSMADQGWACKMTETSIHCTKGAHVKEN